MARTSKYPKPIWVAVEGQQLTDEQLNYFCEYYNLFGVIPGNKIVCNETKKLTTCVGPWMKKKVQEYGGIRELLTQYVSKKRNKKTLNSSPAITNSEEKTKRGRKKKVVSEPKENTQTNIPTIKLSQPEVMNINDLKKITQNTCLRPNIFLNNGRHCEGCPFYGCCECPIKTLPKGVIFQNNQFIVN